MCVTSINSITNNNLNNLNNNNTCRMDDLFITFNRKLVTYKKFYLLSTCNPTITMEWKERLIGWKQEPHKTQVPILTFITKHNEITEYRQYDHNGRSLDLKECYSLMKRLVTKQLAKMNLSEKYRYKPMRFNDFKKQTIYVTDNTDSIGELEIHRDTLENYKRTLCSIEVEYIAKNEEYHNEELPPPPCKKSKYN